MKILSKSYRDRKILKKSDEDFRGNLKIFPEILEKTAVISEELCDFSEIWKNITQNLGGYGIF